MIKIIISGLLLTTSIVLTSLSGAPYNRGLILLFTIIPILVGGFTIGFFISVWSKNNKINSFKNSLLYTFGLSSLIHLSGYIFVSIQSLI